MDENENIEVMLEQIEVNEEDCLQLVRKMKHIREYQETLDMKVNLFETVTEAYQGHQIRKLLWSSLKEWSEMVGDWQQVVFDEINIEEISELSDQYYLKVTKCEARLAGSTAVAKLSKMVRDFRSTMPIVAALGNRYLQDNHWEEIKRLLNMEDSDFALEEK